MLLRLLERALTSIVSLRRREAGTAFLMFACAFLTMTAYNIVKPATRSKFISDLGADNLPWVQLGAGILIGVIMQGYSRAIAMVPSRWAIPITQAGSALLLLAFWALLSANYQWATVGFYVLGLILGILLISQFWMLANDLYDARQAKRLFGFIGGGASLGGATGGAITAVVVKYVGTTNLLLVSAAVLLLTVGVVVWIIRREPAVNAPNAQSLAEEGVTSGEAITLLLQSKHLQIIAIVIGCAAMGGAIVEQQLNMAAEAHLGRSATDGITQLLAQVTVYLSLIGFVIQIAITSRVHRLLGLGFALLILPVSLGMTAGVMIVNAGLWAPKFARILDTSLRYTVDKTTREILFLPLSAAIKHRAKPFVDVTMDRFAKALGAVIILILIKPWGLGLGWQELGYASLTLTAIWIVMAMRAKREYLTAFRRQIERHEVESTEIRVASADLQCIETLVEELAHPDEERVLYAIDLLESIEKRHLVTPLLLFHASPRVRSRAVRVLQGQGRERLARWAPTIEPLLTDPDPDVRGAAIGAIAMARGQDAVVLMRTFLEDTDPRIAVVAAVALARSTDPADVEAAESTLRTLAGSMDSTARQEVAQALGHTKEPRFRSLLVPLLLDAHLEVARAAMASAQRLGPVDFLFVPALISRLRDRGLKEQARTALVAHGEAIVEPVVHFLRDEREDAWVRRHLPAVLSRVPGPRAMEALVRAVSDRDALVRDNAILALETLRRDSTNIDLPRASLEMLVLDECRRYANALTLHANLCDHETIGRDTLLARALAERQVRASDRVFRLLHLMYPEGNIASVRWTYDTGATRARAAACEYLDTLLSGQLRRRVLLMIEDMPTSERVRRVNVQFHTRRRDPEDTLAQLIHDEDATLAAAAIHLVAERGIGTLTADLEYILAHPNPVDRYISEAASWALAATRLSVAERRATWLEPFPVVEVVDRLRNIRFFADVSVEELFRLAASGRQVRHEHGSPLYARGLRPDALLLLIDGTVEGDATGPTVAPAALAVDETLGIRPVNDEMRASGAAITLMLEREDFFTVLSNDTELVRGLFRTLMAPTNGEDEPILRGRPDVHAARFGDGPLALAERSLALRRCPLFVHTPGDLLLRVAEIAREVPLVPGQSLDGGRSGQTMWVVVSGELLVTEADGLSVHARPGDTIGAHETLTSVGRDLNVTVTASGRALSLDRRRFSELLADHVHLIESIIAALLPNDVARQRSSGDPAQATGATSPVAATV